MSTTERVVIALEEYRPRLLAPEELPLAAGELLWRQYSNQIKVEFPSPATGGQWRLTAQGWVGHIPLGPALSIALQPKVPVRSLFAMLEYAYGQKTFQLLGGLYEALSLEELYERLAAVLARAVLRRCRDGLVREYVSQTEELSVVRGSLNVRRMAARPWDVRLECTYQEHTADIDDNQILAWTLFVISRSGLCRPEHALPAVRHAFRQLQGVTTLRPVAAADCVGRRYHRLNADYAPLHALCRFFLEASGPHHEAGDRAMVPFLVDTAQLYEQCVANWLSAHLPGDLRLVKQEPYIIDRRSGLAFAIDLVLRARASGRALAVLDTKYKRVDTPSTDDVAQVVTYAEATGCHEAFLIYPTAPHRPLDAMLGNIRVRSVVFAVDQQLDQAGAQLLGSILPAEQTSRELLGRSL